MKYQQQLDESDCGPACLAMISNHYKAKITITKIREVAGTDKVGTTLAGMVQAAQTLGYQAKALKGDMSAISESLPVPFIAHMVIPHGNNLTDHYVVVETIKKNRIKILDPDPNQKVSWLSGDEFKNLWTGYALFLAPGTDFKIKTNSKNTLLKFLPLLKPQKEKLVYAGIASFVLVLLGIISSMYFRYVIDELLFSQAKSTLHMLSLGMIFLVLIQSFTELCRNILLSHFSFKTDLSLVISYFSHILHLPMRFYDLRKTGEIISRFDDARIIREALSGAVLSVVMDTVMIIAIGPVLYIINSTLFFILLIIVPLISAIVFIFAPIFNRKYSEIKIKNAELNSYLVEAINGSSTVKAMNAQDKVFEEYEKKNLSSFWAHWDTQKLGRLQGLLSGIVRGIGSAVLFWVGSSYIMDGVFTIGSLISFNALSGYFLGPLQRIINLQATLQEAFVSADRLAEIFELEIEQHKEDHLIKLDKIDGDIEIKNVTFRYGTRFPVFKDLSLNIPKGSWTAFVGPSGCGKTTLVKLLLKMYLPEAGDILIDGKNTKDLDSYSLRKLIGYVPQDIFLFSGSVKDNIALHKNEATLDEIINTATQTGANEFIENLPMRYNTQLSERSTSLSGGEQQRLALTRALLGNPDMLIFDEATSNLDTLSENYIHETISKLKEKKITTIIIAHRLSTVVNCDQIFVLDHGYIIQKGTHKKLLEENGMYKSLWKGSLT